MNYKNLIKYSNTTRVENLLCLPSNLWPVHGKDTRFYTKF